VEYKSFEADPALRGVRCAQQREVRFGSLVLYGISLPSRFACVLESDFPLLSSPMAKAPKQTTSSVSEDIAYFNSDGSQEQEPEYFDEEVQSAQDVQNEQSAPQEEDPEKQKAIADGWSAFDAASRKASVTPPVPQVRQVKLPKPTAAELAAVQPQFFEVLTDREVGIRGVKHKFSRGRVISSKHYNLADLHRQGVQLRPVRAP
jgi:hypothetical protein